jgi:Carboxypeptidase regulatory-like domain
VVGKISGTKSDKSGGVIPNARIIATNNLTGVSRSQASNETGFYAFPNLIPGTYAVSASASGFGTEVREGVTLSVDEELVINVELRVGIVPVRVEVQSDAPLVGSTTATVSAVINGKEVRELPLNARDWTQLASLEPGVAIVRTQTPTNAFTDRANRGLGTMLTVAGARPQQDNYRLDLGWKWTVK